MKIHQQLTLPLLVVISLLAFLSHGMPQAGSITNDGPPISKRDDLSNYVVYSVEPTNKDQATAIGNLLKDVVSDPKSISVHDSDLGVAFWSVPLTTEDAKKVGADSNAAAIIQACTQDFPDPTGSDDPDAGIGSGTVNETTYSWCQTGGLPPGVPPEATNPPSAVAVGSAPATTTTPSPVSQQCVQATPDAHKPAVTCSTSTKRNDVTTPLFACTNFCFCQINGEPRVCTTPSPEAKRQLQPVLDGALEPTAAPTLGEKSDY